MIHRSKREVCPCRWHDVTVYFDDDTKEFEILWDENKD